MSFQIHFRSPIQRISNALNRVEGGYSNYATSGAKARVGVLLRKTTKCLEYSFLVVE